MCVWVQDDFQTDVDINDVYFNAYGYAYFCQSHRCILSSGVCRIWCFSHIKLPGRIQAFPARFDVHSVEPKASLEFEVHAVLFNGARMGLDTEKSLLTDTTYIGFHEPIVWGTFYARVLLSHQHR